MKKFIKNILVFIMLVALCPGLVGCKEKTAEIVVPEKIDLSLDNEEPVLKVYDTETKQIKEMELEEYLKGVLAGEMYNDWPIEALKAQAVIARTYTLYYLSNLQSKYAGADISNDVTEAQAYNASKINDNIKKAVEETRGIIIVSEGSPIETWFHSNSGGKTTTANVGLDYKGEENYTGVISSPETEENSENFSWSYTFTKSEVLSALREMGVSVSTITNFKIGETDESGRAKTLKVGDAEFSAATFRLKIGSTKMKSTLINSITISSGSIAISGTGYGHGVGMSQWGARVLAENGKTHEEIINHYYKNIEIIKAEYTR